MHLISPVLLYDMIRIARRGRFVLLRTLYAAFLGLLFYLAYQSSFHWRYRSGSMVSPQELTKFAEDFFVMFMIVQYCFVLLMTPAYVAGGIAEEKERRTLEFMLTTTLHVPEILLSKLLARLSNVALFVLAGLPILSLLQLFGGVNPQWLWFGFAGTTITIVSLGSVSIWASVHCRKPRQAIMFAYMALGGYFLVWMLLLMLYAGCKAVAAGTIDWPIALLLEWWQAGNPFYAALRTSGSPSLSGLNRNISPQELLRNFALFHGVVVALCLVHSIRRLRPVYMAQTYATPKTITGRRHRRRKAVYTPPMMWKELHGDAPRMSRAGKVLFALTVLACMAPLVFMVIQDFQRGFRFWQEAMNVYVRVVGTGVSLLLLLVIAVRAATCVGSERDRQTLESLLSTPLTDWEILRAKWYSSLLAGIPLSILLFLIWGLGVVTGGLHLVALPLLALTMCCYAAFVASVGLYFSSGSRSTTRGLVSTIGCVILWGGGHWIVTSFIVIPLAFALQAWPFIIVAGFTPPAVLGWMAFDWEHPFNTREWGGLGAEGVGMWVSCFLGVGICAALASMFWVAAMARFRRSSGRIIPRGLQ